MENAVVTHGVMHVVQHATGWVRIRSERGGSDRTKWSLRVYCTSATAIVLIIVATITLTIALAITITVLQQYDSSTYHNMR